MITFESLEENLKFLVLEVESQVTLTFRLLNDADPDLLEKVTAKDDYVDNLKTIIENACFSRLHGSAGKGTDDIKIIRATQTIAVNLERIADFCVNIARQTEYLIEFTQLHQSNFQEMFALIQTSTKLILPALQKQDLSEALKICRSEQQLDELYKENFDWIMARLRTGHYVEDLITTLFIFRYLERIGDALLNIGEALIFAATGERIKIEQFDALKALLARAGLEVPLTGAEFKAIWGSRSGCRIGRVEMVEGTSSPVQGLYKEGIKEKVRKEKENIEYWENIMPGLAPRILGYRENTDKATLLVEFLSGRTLDAVILGNDDDTLQQAMRALEATLTEVWGRTLNRHPIPTDYMGQLKSRLDTVRRVHPGFMRTWKAIESLEIRSSEDLIERCAVIEQAYPAPFGIQIHGDFNANNVIFDPDSGQVNYIDFYRSRLADYIQDASVFLVSNFRMPVFEPSLRRRLNGVIHRFFEFSARFARDQEDTSFELRMALALARSFYTSTRFELNQDFAYDMFTRAHYLMEKVQDHQNQDQNFHLEREVLIY
ncbi:MAG: PhoU domain-containing protein [Desulfobacterales bacterium]|jgi:phosphate uptake regulator/aminoglycoside phosphotransferase